MSSESKPSTKFGMSSCGWINVDGFVLACKYESPENIQRCIYDSHTVSWQEAAFKNCAVYNYEMVKRLKAELEAERAECLAVRERLSKYEPVGDDYDDESDDSESTCEKCEKEIEEGTGRITEGDDALLLCHECFESHEHTEKISPA